MLKIVQSIVNAIIGAIMFALGALLLIMLITIVVGLFHPSSFAVLGALPVIGFVATIIAFIAGIIIRVYSLRNKSRKQKQKNSG